ncbi:MAG: glycosyltransferase [bacterium]|nr:glycosyltransferase [bacterium]
MLSKKYNFVILSVLSYDNLLRGRPAALTSELINRNYKMIFLEPPVSVLRYISDKGFNLKILKKFFLRRVSFDKTLIVVHQIPILPFGGYFKWIRKINYIFLMLQFRTIFKGIKMDFGNCIGIINDPWWSELLKSWKTKVLCYDCIDDIKVFSGSRKYPLYKKWHMELIKKVDMFFASAQTIKNDILAIDPTKKITYIPNAVDFPFFNTQASLVKDRMDLASIPRPILGFVGLVSWWIDTELIYETAVKLPNYSFVIIGPIRQPLKELPNIYLLGQKPYEEVPMYIRMFDVCLAPFKIDKVGNAADPLKIYEYLALGKPVVSTDIDELRKLDNLLYIAKNNADFVNCIEKALKERKGDLEIKRKKYAELNSWKARIDTMLQTISEYLESKKVQ